MNNEQLFRQALQRQNDRAAGMKMPADMEQRVMERISGKPKPRRAWLYAAIAAVAASLLLLLMFTDMSERAGTGPAPTVAQNRLGGARASSPATAASDAADGDDNAHQTQPFSRQGRGVAVHHVIRKKAVAKKTATEQVETLAGVAMQAPVAQADVTMQVPVASVIPDPAELIERQYRAEATAIRERGERVMQHVAMISQVQVERMEYVEF